jgi:hypothetical protein
VLSAEQLRQWLHRFASLRESFLAFRSIPEIMQSGRVAHSRQRVEASHGCIALDFMSTYSAPQNGRRVGSLSVDHFTITSTSEHVYGNDRQCRGLSLRSTASFSARHVERSGPSVLFGPLQPLISHAAIQLLERRKPPVCLFYQFGLVLLSSSWHGVASDDADAHHNVLDHS